MDQGETVPVSPRTWEELQMLREEITCHARSTYVVSLWLVTLMLAAWICSLLPFLYIGNVVLAIPALCVGWVWAMARNDFLTHRLALYLRAYSAWEQSEARRRRREMLVLYDGMSMLPILFFLWVGIDGSIKLGYTTYAVIAGLLFLFGLGGLAYAASIFSRRTTIR